MISFVNHSNIICRCWRIRLTHCQYIDCRFLFISHIYRRTKPVSSRTSASISWRVIFVEEYCCSVIACIDINKTQQCRSTDPDSRLCTTLQIIVTRIDRNRRKLTKQSQQRRLGQQLKLYEYYNLLYNKLLFLILQYVNTCRYISVNCSFTEKNVEPFHKWPSVDLSVCIKQHGRSSWPLNEGNEVHSHLHECSWYREYNAHPTRLDIYKVNYSDGHSFQPELLL